MHKPMKYFMEEVESDMGVPDEQLFFNPKMKLTHFAFNKE